MVKKTFLIILSSVFLLIPSVALARIGVGVAAGKIEVTEKLKPGTIYNLPPFTVINTGDEASDYEVNISYHEKQPQRMPPENWFIFSPKEFHLKPGETKTVDIKLNLSVTARPGDYFAYVEGHPLKTAEKGQTTVGIAAATKLYFTVVEGNIFIGVYYKLVSFWQVYYPWPKRVLILLGIIAIASILRKFLHIEVNVRKSKHKDHPQDSASRTEEEHE